MLNPNYQLMIFTDMDGTLLDHDTYSWQPAIARLSQLKLLNIPVICNTSKTYAEVTQLHQSLSLDAPFIVENGSAIFSPAPKNSSSQKPIPDNKALHQLGSKRAEILQLLTQLRQQGYLFEGYSDWSLEQIIQHTGLTKQQAQESATRIYSEPLIWLDSEAKKQEFIQQVNQAGFSALQGGRFLSVQGQCDKGQALNWYKEQFEKDKQKPVITVALGDSANDIAMLEAADVSVWIKSHKAFPSLKKSKQVFTSSKLGPDGWQQTMAHILHLYSTDQLVKLS
ncbi:HAD-IIB family hydrolase [Catenovulum sp. 2E275]|uniref:HAD-IIB family hydrolase n=1 Tax=Catenovulum sp. 2E275 TaxID=2980497 RepID=UPI0021D38079|nr:HAD-IIB family hydrolase [Catenovulum sp. 2E275]MCU4674834.1 HAD-IIB family hydrolase [Catenovulum sp. 2E275]